MNPNNRLMGRSQYNYVYQPPNMRNINRGQNFIPNMNGRFGYNIQNKNNQNILNNPKNVLQFQDQSNITNNNNNNNNIIKEPMKIDDVKEEPPHMMVIFARSTNFCVSYLLVEVNLLQFFVESFLPLTLTVTRILHRKQVDKI